MKTPAGYEVAQKVPSFGIHLDWDSLDIRFIGNFCEFRLPDRHERGDWFA